MKLTKKHLFLLILAFLFLAVLIYTLFPKTTLASLLRLDSKDQIAKIEIGSAYTPDGIYPTSPDHEREWLDITDTPLGDRYIDAFFSSPVKAQDSLYPYYQDLFIETTAVRITLSVSDDYPFTNRRHTIFVGWPEPEGNGFWFQFNLHYTPEEQMRLQEKLNAEGKGEMAKSDAFWAYTLPDSELFTVDFIQKQFE